MNQIQDIGHVTMATKLRRTIWIVASFFLFKPFVTNLFSGWRRLVLRMFGAKIARGANVYPSVKIWAPWNMIVDEDVCIGPNVTCYNLAPIRFGARSVVSQEAYLCTAGHKTGSINTATAGLVIASISIEKDAWIGTRAFIGMGVEVGQGAIVGATASVYKDVAPWTVVGGNPAKVLKIRVMEVSPFFETKQPLYT